MSSSNKVIFKVILISDRNHPYKIFSVPEDTPFTVFMEFVSEQFKTSYEESEVINADGIAVNPRDTAGQVFMKHGSELQLIQRENID